MELKLQSNIQKCQVCKQNFNLTLKIPFYTCKNCLTMVCSQCIDEHNQKIQFGDQILQAINFCTKCNKQLPKNKFSECFHLVNLLKMTQKCTNYEQKIKKLTNQNKIFKKKFNYKNQKKLIKNKESESQSFYQILKIFNWFRIIIIVFLLLAVFQISHFLLLKYSEQYFNIYEPYYYYWQSHYNIIPLCPSYILLQIIQILMPFTKQILTGVTFFLFIVQILLKGSATLKFIKLILQAAFKVLQNKLKLISLFLMLLIKIFISLLTFSAIIFYQKYWNNRKFFPFWFLVFHIFLWTILFSSFWTNNKNLPIDKKQNFTKIFEQEQLRQVKINIKNQK